MSQKIARRKLLKQMAVAGAGLLAASCAPVTTAPTTAPSVVEVTKVVEKQVTQVVEKVVTPTPGPATSASNVTTPGDLPLVKNKVALKILCRGPREFNNNEVIKAERTQTNLDLQYTTLAGAEATTKLNLAVASGDLPDVIRAFGMSLADQQLLAQQGIIIPLDSLIDQYGFWYKQLFKERPEIRRDLSLLDGKIYGLPAAGKVTHSLIAQKMFIYKPWLDKLGLKMPTTTDEFYEVLKAFKTRDPNGNGKADEIPMGGHGPVNSGQAWNSTLDCFVMQAFQYNDRRSSRSLMVENGTIKASYAEAGWKEGLKFLNKLYAEGLIESTVFTNDVAHSQALGENPNVPILGSIAAGALNGFKTGKTSRQNEYEAVPPLKGPSGLQQIPFNKNQTYSPGHFMITKACKNPEAAFRYADFLMSPDATMRNLFGIQDLDWRVAKPGEKAFDGSQASYAQIRPWASDPNTYMSSPPSWLRDSMNPVANPLDDKLTYWSWNVYLPYAVPDKNLPYLLFTVDQSKEVNQLSPVIEAFVDQSFAEFVTGKRNPDKDWDAYLKQLNDLGLAKYLKVYQDAYNAKYKK
jgi:putative aldouronate transport system substrate-binding protein